MSRRFALEMFAVFSSLLDWKNSGKLCLLKDLKGFVCWICLCLTSRESSSDVFNRGGLEGISAVNWFATGNSGACVACLMLARVDILTKQYFDVVLLGPFWQIAVSFLCCVLILRIRFEKNPFAMYFLEGNTVESETETSLF